MMAFNLDANRAFNRPEGFYRERCCSEPLQGMNIKRFTSLSETLQVFQHNKPLPRTKSRWFYVGQVVALYNVSLR